MHYSQHNKGRIDPGALTWDGGSPSYYTHDWNPSTDYTTWSPQIEFMNLVFILKEAYLVNPAYFFEFSVWDGYHTDPERQKSYPSVRSVYRLAGQTYNPERYGGFVQFGMWLTRPRAVRDFRGWTEPWDDMIDKDIKGPLPQVELMLAGGVDLRTAPEFIVSPHRRALTQPQLLRYLGPGFQGSLSAVPSCPCARCLQLWYS